MARYKSCFTLKNVLLIILFIMISTKFIFKESFKEGHNNVKNADNNPDDWKFFFLGAHGPAPSVGISIPKSVELVKRIKNDIKDNEDNEDKEFSDEEIKETNDNLDEMKKHNPL